MKEDEEQDKNSCLQLYTVCSNIPFSNFCCRWVSRCRRVWIFFFFLFLLFLYFHIFPERKVKMSSDIWRTLSSSSQLSLNVIMTEVVTLHKKELRECGEVQFLTFPAGWVLCEGWLSGIYRWVFHSRPGRWTSPTEWTVPVTVVKTGNNKSYYFGWLTRKQK